MPEQIKQKAIGNKKMSHTTSLILPSPVVVVVVAVAVVAVAVV